MTKRQIGFQRARQEREKARARRWEIAKGIVLCAIVMAMLIGFTVMLAIGEWNRQQRVYAFSEVTIHNVESGDTLWAIADAIRNCATQDIRQIIFIIVQMNEWDGYAGLIVPGDILAIPVFQNSPPD